MNGIKVAGLAALLVAGVVAVVPARAADSVVTPDIGTAKPPPGAPPAMNSVMFTPAELAQIAKAVEDHLHPRAVEIAKASAAAASLAAQTAIAKPHVPNIYVSAVLDFGGGDWTVWANGLKVTPGRQSPLFRVTSVSGNSVDIEVPSEAGLRVRLQPNQTWRSREHDVVEGIVP